MGVDTKFTMTPCSTCTRWNDRIAAARAEGDERKADLLAKLKQAHIDHDHPPRPVSRDTLRKMLGRLGER